MKNTLLTILLLATICVIAIFTPNTSWYVHAGLVSLIIILNIQPLIEFIAKTFRISYNKIDGLKVEEEKDQQDIIN